MAAVTLPVGFVRVAWLGPTLTLASATWKNNVDFVTRENAARTTLVLFKPGLSVNSVTTLDQGQFYLFKVKTQFQLDDTLVSLLVPAPVVATDATLQLSGPAGEVSTQAQELITVPAPVAASVLFTTGAGTVQYSPDEVSWTTLPANVSAGSYFLRVLHPNNAAFTLLLTLR